MPSETITLLEDHLGIIFNLQADLAEEQDKIFRNNTDLAAAAEVMSVKGRIQDVTTEMNLMSVDTINLMLYLKGGQRTGSMDV